MSSYVPRRGDLVWLSFSPQAGHEQAGRRPGLVVSPEKYNRRVGLALFCPITNQKKGYPFEVALDSAKISGVVLSDQVRSLDWRERRAELIGLASTDVMAEVRGKLLTLIEEE